MMNKNKQCDFRLPAEWEEQSGIMIAWPHEGTDWAPYLEEIEQTYTELVDAITQYEYVLLLARDPEDVKAKLRKRLKHLQMRRIIFRQMEFNDTWTRDYGPITLCSHHQTRGFFVPNHMLDFKFNGWGEKFKAIPTSFLREEPSTPTGRALSSSRATARRLPTATSR